MASSRFTVRNLRWRRYDHQRLVLRAADGTRGCFPSFLPLSCFGSNHYALQGPSVGTLHRAFHGGKIKTGAPVAECTNRIGASQYSSATISVQGGGMPARGRASRQGSRYNVRRRSAREIVG